MRTLFVAAAIMLASAAVQAGETYNFEIGGHKIYIDPDRGIVSIPGVYEYGPKRFKRRTIIRTTMLRSEIASAGQGRPAALTEPQAPSIDTPFPSSASANVAPRVPLLQHPRARIAEGYHYRHKTSRASRETAPVTRPLRSIRPSRAPQPHLSRRRLVRVRLGRPPPRSACG